SGAATAAALEEAGIAGVLVSSGSTGADFARELIEKEKPGPENRILLPGSEIARGELAAALRSCGARVEELAIYRTCTEEPARAAPLLEALERGETPQAITFASPSAVKGFLDLCGEQGLGLLEDSSVRVISIGPTTSEDIRARGLEVSAQASRPTTEALIDALAEALGE
ncbi:MAG: uroporphyrinogen-III synthase, partial [Planctomycetota bacterium]|nr:uroporphyrinogen-III synthase [Planctomycetota bacterium]